MVPLPITANNVSELAIAQRHPLWDDEHFVAVEEHVVWRHVCRGTGVNDPLQLVKVGGLAGANHECHRGRRLVAVAPAAVATPAPAAAARGRLLALELAAVGPDVALVAAVAVGLRDCWGIARLAIVRGDVGCGVVLWLGDAALT